MRMHQLVKDNHDVYTYYNMDNCTKSAIFPWVNRKIVGIYYSYAAFGRILGGLHSWFKIDTI